MFSRFIVLLVLLGSPSHAQTGCGTRHSTIGAFICYPNPSENAADSTVADIFHLSAQGNAPEGQMIVGYEVRIDNRPIFDDKLPAPASRLSIETNLKSPFNSGTHTLQLVIRGAGSAEVKALQFYPSGNASFCEPFTRTDPRVCSLAPNRTPLTWSPASDTSKPPSRWSLDGYAGFLAVYGQNLKSLEADVFDAMAVDQQGNLYVASHALADVDLRKYSPTGSLLYATLLRSCGAGFLAVAGIAIDNNGRVWIAGNTTACLATTPQALQPRVKEPGATHGFVMLVDTAKPASAAPLYVTYLSDAEAQLAAIRIDKAGNAYLAGATESLEFPHGALLRAAENAAPSSPGKRMGFVAALDPAGSNLLWSTLLQDSKLKLTALALDETGDVFVTGRIGAPCSSGICDDVLVAKLSDLGQRLSFAAQFGGAKNDEGQAISQTAKGNWLFIAADSDSTDFPATPAASTSPTRDLRSYIVALQACGTGVLYGRLLTEADNRTSPGIAWAPALDAFTATFSGNINGAEKAETPRRLTISTSESCRSTTP